ncbi:MAG: MmcQ/YjbR family DNA-binding protein [Anaerovorax sp.]|nr:MmcQ/YjbR family DNA-binding protein [Anaerovorax sp.]
MNHYLWLDAYCQSFKGVLKDFKEEWQATRYLIGGKMFALQGADNTGRLVITLKLNPANGSLLRQQFEDIIPGYYMNKEHWNSVYLDGAVPDEVLKDMINESYTTVLNALPKKIRTEIIK